MALWQGSPNDVQQVLAMVGHGCTTDGQPVEVNNGAVRDGKHEPIRE